MGWTEKGFGLKQKRFELKKRFWPELKKVLGWSKNVLGLKKYFWAEERIVLGWKKCFWVEKKGTRELKRKGRQEEKKQKGALKNRSRKKKRHWNKKKRRRKEEGVLNWTEAERDLLSILFLSNLLRKNYGELVCVGFNF